MDVAFYTSSLLVGMKAGSAIEADDSSLARVLPSDLIEAQSTSMRLSPVPWMTSDGQNEPSPRLMPEMNVTSLYATGTGGPSAVMRRRSDGEKTINGGESARHVGWVDAELTTAPNGPSGMRQDQSSLREQAVRGSYAGGLAESAVFGDEMRWSQESGRYV
eukprot:scaffold144600_cov14-Prasinocladus_malaysianus.AAC.1